MMKRFAFFGLVGSLALAAGAASFSPPPPLDRQQLPALVYSVSEAGKENIDVYIGQRGSGKWKSEPFFSAPFVAVEPLADAQPSGVNNGKFIVAAGPSAQESELYLTDLLAGSTIQLTTRKGHCPLTFPRPHERYFRWKENFQAFLIQDADGADDIEFITVDYGKMTFTTVKIPKSVFGGKFGDDLHIKIGPNGAHFAFMELIATSDAGPRTQAFNLEVYHFADLIAKPVATNVLVQVSEKAPTPFGVPPFEWYDFEHMLWGDMDPAKQGDEANITFFTNDVHREATIPLFSQRIPLTATGGELFRESPLVKEILYRPQGTPVEQFLLNTETSSLDPYLNPLRLRFQNNDGDVQVGTATRLLLHAKHFGGQILDIASPRGDSFAYSLSSGPEVKDAERKSELFANFMESEAEKVAGPAYYTRPLGWIDIPTAPVDPTAPVEELSIEQK